MGRGYSFEVLRARMLYNEEARGKTRTSIRKRIRKRVKGDESETIFSYMMMQAETKPRYKTVIETRAIEYGPYIPTLVKLLKAGEFL